MARDNVWMKMLTVMRVFADVIQNSMKTEQEYAVSEKFQAFYFFGHFDTPANLMNSRRRSVTKQISPLTYQEELFCMLHFPS